MVTLTGDPDAILLVGGPDIQARGPGNTITVYRPGHWADDARDAAVIRVPDDGSLISHDNSVLGAPLDERTALDACIAAAA
jgi:hypothetical protein